MSPGPGEAAEGSAEPGPVRHSRAPVLARLEAEQRQAEGCYEYARAAELGQQIRQLSVGTGVSPAKETTGRTAARKRALWVSSSP